MPACKPDQVGGGGDSNARHHSRQTQAADSGQTVSRARPDNGTQVDASANRDEDGHTPQPLRRQRKHGRPSTHHRNVAFLWPR
ncbi:MAG: hypothetical protein ACK5QX_01685 [bacterium]